MPKPACNGSYTTTNKHNHTVAFLQDHMVGPRDWTTGLDHMVGPHGTASWLGHMFAPPGCNGWTTSLDLMVASHACTTCLDHMLGPHGCSTISSGSRRFPGFISNSPCVVPLSLTIVVPLQVLFYPLHPFLYSFPDYSISGYTPYFFHECMSRPFSFSRVSLPPPPLPIFPSCYTSS